MAGSSTLAGWRALRVSLLLVVTTLDIENYLSPVFRQAVNRDDGAEARQGDPQSRFARSVPRWSDTALCCRAVCLMLRGCGVMSAAAGFGYGA